MTTRLYVGNLAFHSTEEAIRTAFAAHGGISEVKLVIDRMSGQSRGFAFVTMSSDDEARLTINAMNGAFLDGRALRVSQAEERTGGARGPGGFRR
jgi:cold-inducible RNA-binding protein